MTAERPTDRKWFSWDEGRKQLEDYGFTVDRVDLKDLGLVVTPTQEESVDVFFRLGKEAQPVKASSRAVKELNKLLGANVRLLGSLMDNEKLLKQVFDHFKARKAGVDGITFLRDREGVRGLTDDPSRYISPRTVFDVTHDTLGGESVGLANMLYSKARGELEFMALTTDTLEPPRKVGEVSHAGVNLRINGSAVVEPAVYTLVCTNGLISEVGLSRTQIFCENDVKEGVAKARNLLAEFVKLDEEGVQNPAATVARIAREMQLPDRTTRRILDTVNTNLQGEGVTAYEVVNAVTALAHGQTSTRFNRLGHLMMTPLRSARCEHCGAATL